MREPIKVLMFDDDTDILELCTIILRRRGYNVFTSTTCNNLLQTIAEVQPDIIFMDDWIPEIGGIEATHLIKNSIYKDIPIIYFSANSDIQELSVQACADTYLAKPFNISDLEKMVELAYKSKAIKASSVLN